MPRSLFLGDYAPRRFPPPETVEELEACFIVRDSNGQQLAYVYFEEEPGRRSAAKLLTKDEARRIAATSFWQSLSAKTCRALFCAAHFVLNTLVDKCGALVEW